jgi:hypothetical protein
MKSARKTGWLALLMSAMSTLAWADVGNDPGGSGGRAAAPVIIVQSANVRAHAEVLEAFHGVYRLSQPTVRINLTEGPRELVRLRELLPNATVIVAVGQLALRPLEGTRARIVYALASDPPPGAIGVASMAPPEQVFRALRELLPQAKRIVTVSSERGHARVQAARQAATALQLELVELPVLDSPAAIRVLRERYMPRQEIPGAVAAPRRGMEEVIWLGADPLILDRQVLQFVLQLQIQLRVPVIGYTRQQVEFGALMAVDYPLDAIGQQLGLLTMRLAGTPERADINPLEYPMAKGQVMLNRITATRLGLLPVPTSPAQNKQRMTP